MITRFDPTDTLIIVTARIWGPRGDKQLSLAAQGRRAAVVSARE